MSVRTRIWLTGIGLLSLGLCLHLAGTGRAQGDAAIKKSVLKIAALLEKGDSAAAATEAKALAKKVDEYEDLMNVFRPRTKKGIGVGDKAGAVQPDGIELQLNKIGRDAPGQPAANKNAEAFEKMAYVVAAVAEVCIAKPHKNEGKKKSADWIKWAKDMREAGPSLAAAAKSKSPAEIQKAAAKVNNACNNCHSVFK